MAELPHHLDSLPDHQLNDPALTNTRINEFSNHLSTSAINSDTLPILLSVIVTLTLCACARVQTPFELIEDHHVPVEKIYISLQNRGLIKESFASAVVIDDCIAVTNRHVLDRSTQMTGIMAQGEAFAVESSVVSERLDLALFRIPCGIGQPITTGQRVKEGDTIYSVGTARGDPYLTGEVQYPLFELYHQKLALKHPIGGKDDGHSVTLGFLYTGKFKKGFSGGPVVNASGELVGINQGYLRRFLSTASAADIHPRTTYGLAYHIDDVLEEVEQLRKHLRR